MSVFLAGYPGCHVSAQPHSIQHDACTCSVQLVGFSRIPATKNNQIRSFFLVLGITFLTGCPKSAPGRFKHIAPQDPP